MFERGKIVLIPFPFADEIAHKVRPAVIISQARYTSEQSLVLALISSVIPDVVLKTDIIIKTKQPYFSTTGLKVASVIRCYKLATIDRNLILGEIGQLHRSQLVKVNQCLKLTLGLEK